MAEQTRPNPYRDLTIEQANQRREELQNQYWDVMELLGSIAVEKALVSDHIQELIRKTLRDE